MFVHLWADGPIPDEYVDLILCRELHCLPSQLAREPAKDILAILTMMGVEGQVRRLRNKMRG